MSNCSLKKVGLYTTESVSKVAIWGYAFGELCDIVKLIVCWPSLAGCRSPLSPLTERLGGFYLSVVFTTALLNRITHQWVDGYTVIHLIRSSSV